MKRFIRWKGPEGTTNAATHHDHFWFYIRLCPISSDFARLHFTRSCVRLCPVLSDFVRFCWSLSDFDRFCLISFVRFSPVQITLALAIREIAEEGGGTILKLSKGRT